MITNSVYHREHEVRIYMELFMRLRESYFGDYFKNYEATREMNT